MNIKSFNRIRRNLLSATQRAGDRARFFVDKHAREGDFRSGDLASAGYSTSWIPAFFLGEATINESGITVRNYFTSAKLPDADIEWRKWNGKATAFYTKGYKGFRELTGRQTATVDLTFSGQMLRNLTSRSRQSGNKLIIEVFVKNPYNDRMLFTNARREWLYLKPDEIEKVKDTFAKTLLK